MTITVKLKIEGTPPGRVAGIRQVHIGQDGSCNASPWLIAGVGDERIMHVWQGANLEICELDVSGDA